MGSTNKFFSLLLVVILVTSSLMMVEYAFAQSIPKPSVPEFTLNLIKSSYNMLDPYTKTSQQIDNSSIIFTIKNQPFTYLFNDTTYRLYYNFRMKPQIEGNWTEQNPVFYFPNAPYNTDTQSFSRSFYIWDDPPPPSQSTPDYTVVIYVLNSNTTNWALSGLPPDSKIDFQVEAIVGHNSQRWIIEHPLYPTNGGYYGPAIAYDSDSGWSDTQTITIGETSATASPSPTVPELSWLMVVPLLLFLFSVAVILRHRKPISQNKPNV